MSVSLAGELGLSESTSIRVASGANSAIIWRQAPQGGAPLVLAMAIALKRFWFSVKALKMATRSAQQLRP